MPKFAGGSFINAFMDATERGDQREREAVFKSLQAYNQTRGMTAEIEATKSQMAIQQAVSQRAEGLYPGQKTLQDLDIAAKTQEQEQRVTESQRREEEYNAIKEELGTALGIIEGVTAGRKLTVEDKLALEKTRQKYPQYTVEADVTTAKATTAEAEKATRMIKAGRKAKLEEATIKAEGAELGAKESEARAREATAEAALEFDVARKKAKSMAEIADLKPIEFQAQIDKLIREAQQAGVSMSHDEALRLALTEQGLDWKEVFATNYLVEKGAPISSEIFNALRIINDIEKSTGNVFQQMLAEGMGKDLEGLVPDGEDKATAIAEFEKYVDKQKALYLKATGWNWDELNAPSDSGKDKAKVLAGIAKIEGWIKAVPNMSDAEWPYKLDTILNTPAKDFITMPPDGNPTREQVVEGLTKYLEEVRKLIGE